MRVCFVDISSSNMSSGCRLGSSSGVWHMFLFNTVTGVNRDQRWMMWYQYLSKYLTNTIHPLAEKFTPRSTWFLWQEFSCSKVIVQKTIHSHTPTTAHSQISTHTTMTESSNLKPVVGKSHKLTHRSKTNKPVYKMNLRPDQDLPEYHKQWRPYRIL